MEQRALLAWCGHMCWDSRMRCGCVLQRLGGVVADRYLKYTGHLFFCIVDQSIYAYFLFCLLIKCVQKIYVLFQGQIPWEGSGEALYVRRFKFLIEYFLFLYAAILDENMFVSSPLDYICQIFFPLESYIYVRLYI